MSTQLASYPCDRGMPNNAYGRGYHNFALTPGTGRAVCTLCGTLAPVQIIQQPKLYDGGTDGNS